MSAYCTCKTRFKEKVMSAFNFRFFLLDLMIFKSVELHFARLCRGWYLFVIIHCISHDIQQYLGSYIIDINTKEDNKIVAYVFWWHLEKKKKSELKYIFIALPHFFSLLRVGWPEKWDKKRQTVEIIFPKIHKISFMSFLNNSKFTHFHHSSWTM